MRHSNTIGVDLAKNVIQVSVVSPFNKELSNKELSRAKFAEFLAKQKPGMVAFEACATAHYWARCAVKHGHEVKIIPALSVAPFRQGHKTDKNDALAIAEAANRPNVKVAPLKSIEQQAMQSIQRSRELIIHDRTAISNHIRSLLLECLTSITLSARVASTENVTTNVNAINPVSRWFFCQSTPLAFLPRFFYASLSL